jgi:hypothetical protein
MVGEGQGTTKVRPYPGRQTSSRVRTQPDTTSTNQQVRIGQPLTFAGSPSRSREVRNLRDSSAASPNVHTPNTTVRTPAPHCFTLCRAVKKTVP